MCFSEYEIPEAIILPNAIVAPSYHSYQYIPEETGFGVKFENGAFCQCFPLVHNSNKVCFRCWVEDEKREEHLQHILDVSRCIGSRQYKYVVKKYEYIHQALRVNDIVIPAVIMEWIEGDVLLAYVKKNRHNQFIIKSIAEKFYTMVRYMLDKGMAHGDLSGHNIIVTSSKELVMIDYDTLFIAGYTAENVVPSTGGIVCYQHPHRTTLKYLSAEMDYYSQLVIYLSLLIVAEKPEIVNIRATHGLVFQEEDLRDLSTLKKSQVYKDVSAIKNQEIQLYLKELVRAISGPLSAVRSLVDVKKEIDENLHPARSVEPVQPLPSTHTTQTYNATCLICGKKITTTAEIKYCPYCGNLLQNNNTSTDSGLSDNILELLERIEKNNKRREEKQRKYLAEQKRLAEEQKRLAEERKFVNRWKKFWGNVWNVLCGFFDEIAELIFLLIIAILMLPIIGPIFAGCSVYYSKSGDKYFYGQEGVQQNYVQAVQEYKQIYPLITFNSKRTTNSTYNLATCYEYGLGTNKDSIQAFDRYLKAAKKGHIMAMNKVAQFYAIGYGTIQSTEESSKWFEKSLRKGSAEELLEVGWQYESGNRLIQDYAQAMKCYTAAAKKGFAAAQMKVGDCYMIGTCGVQKNTAEAANWYQMAADQGDREAIDILHQLQSRIPTSREINRWYQTGCNYYHGNNGVKIDYAEAIKWYRKAALMGHADAQNYLGVCYDLGRGLNEDDVEAVKWYRKSAAQGYKYAQNNLGVCYECGSGLNEDDIEAVKWYRKAAEQGHADAQNNLGNRLYNGQGIIKNYAEAAKWYRKSAENGNQNAQYNLGWCYQYGQGVTKNLTEAKKWYQKAADKGHESAKKKLVELNQ